MDTEFVSEKPQAPRLVPSTLDVLTAEMSPSSEEPIVNHTFLLQLKSKVGEAARLNFFNNLETGDLQKNNRIKLNTHRYKKHLDDINNLKTTIYDKNIKSEPQDPSDPATPDDPSEDSTQACINQLKENFANYLLKIRGKKNQNSG